MVRLSLLAALFLSFTVAGEFDHVVLLLLLLLGQHLLLGPQHQLRDAVEHLQEETRTGGEFNDTAAGSRATAGGDRFYLGRTRPFWAPGQPHSECLVQKCVHTGDSAVYWWWSQKLSERHFGVLLLANVLLATGRGAVFTACNRAAVDSNVMSFSALSSDTLR